MQINQKPKLPERRHPIVMIGAGGIVHDAHLPAYQKAGFPVVGIYDLNHERAQALGNKFGIESVAETLEEVIGNAPADAVFDVATPPVAFSEILNALPEGRGVLLQKPMGETLAEAREIREACRRKKLTAAVNFQLRSAPAILAARSLIDQGAIGEVHCMEVKVSVFTPWHMFPFLEGRPRLEIVHHSVHYLDLVRSFFGNPGSVYGRTVQHPNMPQLASTRTSMFLNYSNSDWVNISVNHGHEYGPRHQESYVKWEGTKGAIKTRMGLLMDYPQGLPDYFEYCILENDKPSDWQAVELEGTWFPDAFIGSMSSLMRKVEGSTDELPTSVEDAYNTMAVVEAAYESNQSGGTKVNYD